MSESGERFYGKYRGTVSNNLDPLMQGRLLVKVPSVLGDQDSGWAMPCSPYGGSNVGFFSIPPVGANVWVEFEEGKPDHPIWSGTFWGVGEAPAMDPTALTRVIKTNTVTITIDDKLGSITIENVAGMKIAMDPTGITLTCGASSVALTPVSVSVNDGALEVV